VGAELGVDIVRFAEVLGGKWYSSAGDGRKWRSLTARFRADDVDVVFKATASGLSLQNIAVERFVARSFPGRVAHVLAYRETDDQVWFLHEYVEGRTLRQQASGGELASLARALAEVQVIAASLDLSGLPLMRPSEVPTLLLKDGLGDQSAGLVRWLMRAQPWLKARAEELEAFPLSLDHADVSTSNALVRPDGQIVLVDWEETIVSSPFFSVERLLGQAEDSDTMGEVAERYLERLPWGTESERWSALHSALCLTPLKSAYEARVFARRLGRGDPHTAWTSLLVANARERSRRAARRSWTFRANGSRVESRLDLVRMVSPDRSARTRRLPLPELKRRR
jgi:thiamine kinase-like enzyme